MLHGVCFFSSENNTYSVDLEVINTESKSVLVSKTGQFSSELLQCEKGSYFGFKVLFDTKIILEKNTTYCIRALISGSNSYGGLNCNSSVQCSGVTFTFMKSEYSTNYMAVAQGQFPELLFSL